MGQGRASRWLVLALALSAGMSLHAQDRPGDTDASPRVVAGRSAGTGNAWIDTRLRDMGTYAARYRNAFVDEIVRYHEAPREVVEEALTDEGLDAGDVYLACALAQLAGRACRDLVEARRANPGAGWEAIATQAGHAPDAALYRRLRGEITASYARWARPIDAGEAAPP